MISSHNKKCDIGPQQYGCTLTFLKDQVTHYWTNSGIDESCLGLGGLKVICGNEKENELKNWIVENEIDVLGIQEVGINWSNCKRNASQRNRMKFHGWEFTRMLSSHNNKCDIVTQQYGGTLTSLNDQVTHY